MMVEGTIKWFDRKKGYGFISRETEQDVFVHYTNLAEPTLSLKDGDKVVFELTKGEKGPAASKVVLKA